MKPYPMSKSRTARWAAWMVAHEDGMEKRGSALLSTTHRNRALRRLVAHLQKELPGAMVYEARWVEDRP